MPTHKSHSIQRLGFLDWLRAAGIIAVVLYHAVLEIFSDAVSWRGAWWNPGEPSPGAAITGLLLHWSYVPSMFFLISGYLIHRSVTRRPDDSPAPLLIRRVSRLYVAYLVALVLFAAVWPWTRLSLTPEGMMQFATHALLIFNFSSATLWEINPSFWYIATEVQLCALYPVWLRAARRWGWRRTVISLLALSLVVRATAAGLAWRWYGAPELLDNMWALYSFPANIGSWALGAWLAEQQRLGALRRPSLLLVVGMPLVGLLFAVTRPLVSLLPFVMAIAYYFLVRWLLTRPSSAPAAHGSWFVAPLRFVGTLTLGAYLLNQPMLDRVVPWLLPYFSHKTVLLFVSSGVTMVLVLPAAWLLLRTVEEPLSRLVDRTLERLRQPDLTPDQA